MYIYFLFDLKIHLFESFSVKRTHETLVLYTLATFLVLPHQLRDPIGVYLRLQACI